MPFTAGLSEDRQHNAMAQCAHLMRVGTWDTLTWEARMAKCRGCAFRFHFQPTCSLDFMQIGDTDDMKHALGEFIDYISTDPPWSDFPGAAHEVEYAYRQLGEDNLQRRPGEAFEDFVKCCVAVDVDSDFWKQWNYIMVEGYEGEVVHRDMPEGPASKIVKKIVDNLLEPTTYWGERLYKLHAAASMILEFGIEQERPSIGTPFRLLVEATRKAIVSSASLKIS